MDEITKIRKDLRRLYPAIYDTCYAHLSDPELITTLNAHRAALLARRPGNDFCSSIPGRGIPSDY
jgi:hypothetical protein